MFFFVFHDSFFKISPFFDHFFKPIFGLFFALKRGVSQQFEFAFRLTKIAPFHPPDSDTKKHKKLVISLLQKHPILCKGFPAPLAWKTTKNAIKICPQYPASTKVLRQAFPCLPFATEPFTISTEQNTTFILFSAVKIGHNCSKSKMLHHNED